MLTGSYSSYNNDEALSVTKDSCSLKDRKSAKQQTVETSKTIVSLWQMNTTTWRAGSLWRRFLCQTNRCCPLSREKGNLSATCSLQTCTCDGSFSIELKKWISLEPPAWCNLHLWRQIKKVALSCLQNLVADFIPRKLILKPSVDNY